MGFTVAVLYHTSMEASNTITAGLDEVGRGAFAGPLIAGCVAMVTVPPKHIKINDSKKLTAKQREVASKWIRKNALTWGIGQASVKYIDKFGITKAENYAFRQAVRNANKKLLPNRQINQLVIDAFFVPKLRGIPRSKQFAIKGADGKSKLVASASIIAKVNRDELMSRLGLSPRYKKYKWDENKGYGTKQHRDALKQLGATIHHRKLFLKKS